MERVIITRPVQGLFFMQVCAVKNATDEEILKKCNRDNPAGTINGWSRVIRETNKELGITKKSLPVKCKEHLDRIHYLITC